MVKQRARAKVLFLPVIRPEAPAPKKRKLMPSMPLWPTGPLDVTVSFDGTRGYTGLYGVFVVMSWDTIHI